MSDAAISNWIAGAALLVALVALLVAAWTSQKQTRLQSRLVRIEEARDLDRQMAGSQAQLEGKLFAGNARMSAHLRITNVGAAAARNIRITVDKLPILEHPGFRQNVLPETIAQGASVALWMFAFDGMKTRYHVGIAWDDESGRDGHWTSDISMLPADAR
jgi:hypothetical protein